MKPFHFTVTISAVVGVLIAVAVSLTALSQPLHVLFGVSADRIVATAAIISGILSAVAGAGESPIPPQK